MTVMKFMLTAIITGGFGVYTLKALRVVTMLPIPATFWLGNILGGLIFGVGMALAGFCPGSIIAGIGEGKVDYLVAGVLGMFAGSFFYGLTYDPAMQTIKAIGSSKITIPELVKANPFLVLAVLAVVSSILFYFFYRGLKRKDKLQE